MIKPLGPYSPIVKAGDFYFISGQIPLDSGAGIAEQTKQSLEHLKEVLATQGLKLNQVVKTTVFLKNMNDFAVMNEVYAGYFPENPPARSTIEVARLPKDMLIEVEAIAHLSRTPSRAP